jgi:hypothetical protein
MEGKLLHGAPLLIEDLELSGIGMYSDRQKDKLLSEGGSRKRLLPENPLGNHHVGSKE